MVKRKKLIWLGPGKTSQCQRGRFIWESRRTWTRGAEHEEYADSANSLFRTMNNKTEYNTAACQSCKRLIQNALKMWCGRGDSNPHDLATASPSSWSNSCAAPELTPIHLTYVAKERAGANASDDFIRTIRTRFYTTLSVSQFDFFELEHPLQVVRLRHEEMRGQHLLDDGAHAAAVSDASDPRRRRSLWRKL